MSDVLEVALTPRGVPPPGRGAFLLGELLVDVDLVGGDWNIFIFPMFPYSGNNHPN